MLALEMGMGKTLCAIAVHALDQHHIPEGVERTTAHSDADLQKSETILVGKRYPDEHERENLKEVKMFTGFKQLDDGAGTIVPDGSVRHLLLTCLPPTPASG